MDETQTTLTAADLVVGARYRVAFFDCCVQGFLVGRFVEVRTVDDHGQPFEEAIVFDTGEISPVDWGEWKITRT